MRIIGGSLKGRRFNPPRSLPVRPTTDFSKESLFNILSYNFDLSEIRALDLFAGTGNISYELASRGCNDITSVDSNRGCIRYISETAASLGIDENIDAVLDDALDFLEYNDEKFDFIFADPPYTFKSAEKLVEIIFTKGRLSEGGLFILEHEPKLSFENHTHLIQQRKHGSSVFSFFK